MATPIAVVPVLTGEVARRFVERAEEVSRRKDTIDLTEEMKIVKEIIAKARADGEDV
jgi:hypothetical protein